MRLRDLTAIVTGGGRGIGRAIARGYAQEGAHIAIAEIDSDAGLDAADEIRGLGQRSFFVQTDMSRKDQIDRMVEVVLEEFGHLDILVNNAGVHISQPFLEASEETYDRTLATNLKGAFFCAQAVARHMVATRRRGKIINISSVSAEIADRGSSHYCISKGGMQMLTRSAALELAPYHINVNSIAPGTIETELGGWYATREAQIYLEQKVPWQAFGKPEDVVGAAVFLACNDSDYITGASLVIDGGLLTA